MRRIWMLGLWLGLWAFAPGLHAAHAAGGQPLYTGSKFSLGMDAWISSGKTEWNHNVSSSIPTAGNPSSKLVYDKLDSTVYEFNAELRLPNWFFIRAGGGLGSIGSGKLTDDDYLNVGGGDFLASRSKSDVFSDGLWFANVDFGSVLVRGYTAEGQNVLRWFFGYQHWQETHMAKTVTYEHCTVGGFVLGMCLPAGAVSADGQKVITNETQWDSLRLGLDLKLRPHPRFGIEATAAYIPITRMRNEDTHHLRDDLRQPGFIMTGWGNGYNLDVNAAFFMTRRLSLRAGYRYWKLTSDGNVEIRGTEGSGVFPLNGLDSTRSGFTLGLAYYF